MGNDGKMELNGSETPTKPDRENGEGVFRAFTRQVSLALGSPRALIIAIVLTLIWAATGPTFHFSDTWQLVINTGTSVVTFLMVFLIQNTQNRDAKAVHLKLDELIRASKDARNHLVDLQKLSDAEMTQLEKEFTSLRTRARREAVD